MMNPTAFLALRKREFINEQLQPMLDEEESKQALTRTQHPIEAAEPESGVTRVKAWGVSHASENLGELSITRRQPLSRDVVIDILYCGICHSDLHHCRNDWNDSVYPMVPGHEID